MYTSSATMEIVQSFLSRGTASDARPDPDERGRRSARALHPDAESSDWTRMSPQTLPGVAAPRASQARGEAESALMRRPTFGLLSRPASLLDDHAELRGQRAPGSADQVPLVQAAGARPRWHQTRAVAECSRPAPRRAGPAQGPQPAVSPSALTARVSGLTQPLLRSPPLVNPPSSGSPLAGGRLT